MTTKYTKETLPPARQNQEYKDLYLKGAYSKMRDFGGMLLEDCSGCEQYKGYFIGAHPKGFQSKAEIDRYDELMWAYADVYGFMNMSPEVHLPR